MVTRKNQVTDHKVHHNDSFLPPVLPPDTTNSMQLQRSSERSAQPVSFLQQLSLRKKVALFAIAMSAFPLLGTVMVQSWQSQAIDQASQRNLPAQETVRAAAQPLLLSYLGIVGLNAILAGGMAVFLTDRVLRPVLKSSGAVRKIGQGHLETRLAVEGKDELAVLAGNINWMAEQFQGRLQQQSAAAQQIHLLKQVTLDLAQSRQVNEALPSIVAAIRQSFQFDRVLLYRMDEGGASALVADSVAPLSSLDSAIKDSAINGNAINGSAIKDSAIADGSIRDSAIAQLWLHSAIKQPQGHVEAVADIATVDLPEESLEQLAALSIKASLTAPIVIQGQCLGILMAHQCRGSYEWQMTEIDAWSQIAMQIGLAWERKRSEGRAEVAAQAYRYQQDSLQAQLNKLLKELEQTLGSDFISTAPIEGKASPAELCEAIAQVFDATMGALHSLSAKVKQAAVQLDAVAAAEAQATTQLSRITVRQTVTLSQIRSTIENLKPALKTIATYAHQSSTTVRTVLEQTEARAQLIHRAEDQLLKWQTTTSDAIEQADQLDHDCQEVIKVTAFVNQLILQIHILAVNASLQSGQSEGAASGMTPVVAQLNELLTQLRGAMQQIGQLTLNLHHETSGVVKGVKHGMALTSIGKEFDQRIDLQADQTQAASGQIDQMMQFITRTAETQMDTAQTVLNLMQKLSSDAQDVSTDAAQSARSPQPIAAIAQQLRNSLQDLKIKER
jgi:methyl-accepting chemotaxis protein PixJ